MKVLVVRGQNIDLGADSAVLRCGEPVFVPDPASDWLSLVAPAVRICRLGMCMGNRARAYFDSLACFHLLIPAPGKAPAGIPYALIDRTFSPGTWQPLEPAADSATRTLEVRRTPISSRKADASQIIELEKEFSIDSLRAAETIARVSRYCTLKTGDVFIFADAAAELGHPVLDTTVEAGIDACASLSVRIK